MNIQEASSRVYSKLKTDNPQVSAITSVIIIEVITTLLPLILRYCKTGLEIQQAAEHPKPAHKILVRWRIKRALAKNGKLCDPKLLENAIIETAAEASPSDIQQLIDGYQTGRSTCEFVQ